MLQTNRQTDRQTDKQTDSKILPTPTDIVGVGKNTQEYSTLKTGLTITTDTGYDTGKC